MNQLSPIILFVYNRPVHTQRLLKSLSKNYLADKSELFIFADGIKKNDSKDNVHKIKETRRIIRLEKWCKKVTIIERKNNLGLANSIISGVNKIINKYGKAIVLEDDLILSRFFLKYMNAALVKYAHEDRVMEISGYMYPVDVRVKNDAIFLPLTSSWGWATWKRSWKKIDYKMKGIKILENNPEIRKKFDIDGAFPFYRMLINQKKSKINSWAIRFYLSVFLQGGLTLFPRKTLSINAGFDGSGTHSTAGIAQSGIDNTFEVKKYDNIATDKKTLLLVTKFLRGQNRIFVKLVNIINYRVFL